MSDWDYSSKLQKRDSVNRKKNTSQISQTSKMKLEKVNKGRKGGKMQKKNNKSQGLSHT